MARKPMVTRTITTTEVVILALDIEKGEPFNEKIVLPRVYNDDKKLLAKVQEIFDTADKKAVHIVSKSTVDTLYGMSEDDFIHSATKLDPTTRKEIEDKTTETAPTETATETVENN